MMGLIGVLVMALSLASVSDTPVPLGDAAAWTSHPADGVTLNLSNNNGALDLDFVFTGGGYAIARREVDLNLPDNYMFRFKLRGDALPNHLEFKLVDSSGQNVWWKVYRDVEWPPDWKTYTIKKRQIGFAWGPAGGGELQHVAAIEIAVTAGSGGSGTVSLEGLEMVPLPVVSGPPPTPVATASSEFENQKPAAAIDNDPNTYWAASVRDSELEFKLDFGRPRELGGLTIDWLPGEYATNYQVEGSYEGKSWDTLLEINNSNGGRDNLYLPETEVRWLRLRMQHDKTAPPPAISEITLRPLDWSATREAFFMNIAQETDRGLYPQGFLDEPTAWTVVGIDHDTREGLIGSTGAVEAGPGEFSVEPFLWVDDQLITWNDVAATPSLADDYLPIPSVTWIKDNWRLTITAVATGDPKSSAVLANYRVENFGNTSAAATLYLAIRPFQVNPPVQFLNVCGGTAPIQNIALSGADILIDGRPRVRLLSKQDSFGATTFASGDIVADYLTYGFLPTTTKVEDKFRSASAAAGYQFKLAAGDAAEVALLLPLFETMSEQKMVAAEAVNVAAENWRELLNRFEITGPPAAHDAIATMKAQIGDILVNRAGVGIQPGTRSYARSWIRDGALTGVALLRTGHPDAVRDFLNWYAPHQYKNGKIPCVVDWRGADPVPEHDSTGEFIYLLTEYYRYTGDRQLLEYMWPQVVAGAEYLEFLLNQRRTPEYQTDEQIKFYGILPPSISHEGYAAKPMHSYWDDFFALRGLKDAAWLAAELDSDKLDWLKNLRDSFATDLGNSVAAAMDFHDINYIPGCADLGDFDATSTTIALDPADAQNILPAGALEQTFTRYWKFFSDRANGEPWEAFTPYEVRNIGAFVRLGWRDRAHELIDFFMYHRTPQQWRQWAEVVASDPNKARFIGDMPHTWVGSDYVRSFLDLFAYELPTGPDGLPAMVLAAGLPNSWLKDGGVNVGELPTPYGLLSYTMKADGQKTVMKISEGLKIPTGGILIAEPINNQSVTVNGHPARLDTEGRVIVTRLPAEIRW